MILFSVNGGYSVWTEYGACSAPCGEGTHSRTRTCTNPVPAYGGFDCAKLGEAVQTRPCKIKECPSKFFIFRNEMFFT